LVSTVYGNHLLERANKKVRKPGTTFGLQRTSYVTFFVFVSGQKCLTLQKRVCDFPGSCHGCAPVRNTVNYGTVLIEALGTVLQNSFLLTLVVSTLRINSLGFCTHFYQAALSHRGYCNICVKIADLWLPLRPIVVYHVDINDD
jgi:hypothetical protein